MSAHRISNEWQRGSANFARGDYPKDHVLRFSGGQELPASAATAYGGNAALADPEQVLLSALSSCHLLTFLAVAANRGYIVDRYSDDAECELGKNEDGKTAVTRAILRPVVQFSGERQPDAHEFALLHERAHAACFIAQSIRTRVQIDPRFA